MYTVLIICDDASDADVSSLRAYLELSDLRVEDFGDGDTGYVTIGTYMYF